MAERGVTAKLGDGDLDLLELDPPPSSPASTSGSPPAAPSLSGRPLSLARPTASLSVAAAGSAEVVGVSPRRGIEIPGDERAGGALCDSQL
jgi:hypothetical protein